MRTVDPELWSSKVKARRLLLARPFRFGKKTGREAWLRDSLGDAMMEFVRTCSVGGVRRLVSPHTGKWDRYLWLVLLALALFCGLLVSSLDLTALVEEPPLYVRLQSTHHPIRQLPFPAIAICSYNVISEKALRRLTSHLAMRDEKHQYTTKEMRRNLLTFGSLLTMTLPPLDLEFMPFLTGGDGYRFNVSLLMHMLAPTCESILVRCSWRGVITPCDRLFALRLTSVGFCCVFNSRYDPVDYRTPAKVLDMVGADNGLSVILKDDQEDVAFLRKPNLGYEILMFEGSEYPMLEGGVVRVGMTFPNSSAFYALSTRQQRASPSLAYYTEAWRGCRLRQPDGELRLRSYGWCLLACRRRAARQLCGCVPYTLLPSPDDLVCSLNQLSCLNKHKEKFLYYYPYGYSTTDALSEESQDALFCEECRADCARAAHSAAFSLVRVPMRLRHKLVWGRFVSGLRSVHNISVVRFFYQTEHQLLYAVEGNNNWYETLASMISKWVVVVGLPLTTVLELVFHCSVRWRRHYVRRRAAPRR